MAPRPVAGCRRCGFSLATLVTVDERRGAKNRCGKPIVPRKDDLHTESRMTLTYQANLAQADSAWRLNSYSDARARGFVLRSVIK
jgi:hypothetical protein